MLLTARVKEPSEDEWVGVLEAAVIGLLLIARPPDTSRPLRVPALEFTGDHRLCLPLAPEFNRAVDRLIATKIGSIRTQILTNVIAGIPPRSPVPTRLGLGMQKLDEAEFFG